MDSRSSKIKILVTYHKPAVLFKDDILTPIHCGRAVAEEVSKDNILSKEDIQWMQEHMIGDNTGDNISSLNRYYSEFTALYWAWKNYEKLGNPDYIGVMHYRRIFDFLSKGHSKSPLNQHVLDAVQLIGQQTAKTLEKYDFIAVAPNNLHEWGFNSLEEHYLSFPAWEHHPQLLNFIREQIQQHHLELLESYDRYCRGSIAFFNTMFVLPREQFFSLCELMFPMMEAFQKNLNDSSMSVAGRRNTGHVGEYLTGFYLYHLSRQKRTAFIPRLFLTNSDLPTELYPAFKNNNIPVLFSSDDKFVPYLAVCIQSLLAHISDRYNYDLLILEEKISSSNKMRLQALCRNKKNVSLRFMAVEPWMRNINTKSFYVYNQYTVSAYYRLFAPDILSHYDKVVYLDADTVLCHDIAELFQTDLKDNLIAATLDLGISCRFREDSSYFLNTLKITYKQYIQSGVIIMNLVQMRYENFTDKVQDALKAIPRPRLVDQDIFNYICKNRTLKLSAHWNVLWAFPYFISDWKNKMPADLYEEYMRSRLNPYIIHYAGPKPWQQAQYEMAEVFWHYARQTPFYEEIIYRHTNDVVRGGLARTLKTAESSAVQTAVEIAAYPRVLRKYYRYKILSKLTWGKKRLHYKHKRNEWHEKVRRTRKLFL